MIPAPKRGIATAVLLFVVSMVVFPWDPAAGNTDTAGIASVAGIAGGGVSVIPGTAGAGGAAGGTGTRGVAVSGVARSANKGFDALCERCHGMRTMAYHDQRTGRMVSLFVDRQKLAQSSHKQQACLDCHGSGFKVFPHDAATRLETRHCVDCHMEGGRFQRNKFEHIERDFLQSVHFQAMPDRFDCFSCHDPHAFQTLRNQGEIGALIQRDNQICLGCHSTPAGTTPLSKRRFTSLETTHNWLPQVALHWRSVRCLECHTPALGGNHVILKASYAERNCVSCHTRDSMLLTKLYKFRAQEDRQKAGFINSVVLNDAYIVGATRNHWLDRASVALVGFTLLGVVLHGLGRWITARRQKRE
ncbi:MAG: nitrate reductase [Magnetococcales bacterium]|nr:nitrate reductase [Magnetococcales bacterium]